MFQDCRRMPRRPIGRAHWSGPPPPTILCRSDVRASRASCSDLYPSSMKARQARSGVRAGVPVMINLKTGRLPIKVDATSNGEFRPVPVGETVTRARALAAERIGEHARRTGVGRRAFLQSLCGAATTLLTLDEAFAARGASGGVFRVP